MTRPCRRRWLLVCGLPIPSGMVVVIGGCAPAPAIDSPDTPPASPPTPVVNEAAPADRTAVPAPVETAGEPAAPSSVAAPPRRPAPSIAVGPGAREVQYASLAGGRHALTSSDLGYFIDVHEARLRQALTDTPVRMERDEHRLRLTVPGSLSFAPGSADILEPARPVLIAIAAVLAEFDKTLVSVHGHTDRSGDSDYNRALSERRAVAVARFLAGHGVERPRLVGIGHGEDTPVVNGDSEAAHAANRRIEILIEPVVAGDKVASIVER